MRKEVKRAILLSEKHTILYFKIRPLFSVHSSITLFGSVKLLCIYYCHFMIINYAVSLSLLKIYLILWKPHENLELKGV